MTLYSLCDALKSLASLTTTSLFGPVIACHHWISVTAFAGDAAKASVTAVAAAAPNSRKAIKTPPVGPPFRLGALSAPDDVQMTVIAARSYGGRQDQGSPNREEGVQTFVPAWRRRDEMISA